jgi:hypothetical protein
VRHDGGVGDAQVLHSMQQARLIDHRHRIAPDPSCRCPICLPTRPCSARGAGWVCAITPVLRTVGVLGRPGKIPARQRNLFFSMMEQGGLRIRTPAWRLSNSHGVPDRANYPLIANYQVFATARYRAVLYTT